MQVRRFLSVPHVERHGSELALLIALAGLLELAAGVGLAYVAGFSRVHAVLGDVHWGWLIALAGLKLGVLALGGCGAAIAVLVSGLGVPQPDFTLPWAIIPVPTMLIGFWGRRTVPGQVPRPTRLARRRENLPRGGPSDPRAVHPAPVGMGTARHGGCSGPRTPSPCGRAWRPSARG